MGRPKLQKEEKRHAAEEDEPGEEETDKQEQERYDNHVPGELERLLGEFTEAHIAAEHDTPEHTEGGNSRYEDKEDRTSQQAPEQQQAAEQENKTRRNPGEAEKQEAQTLDKGSKKMAMGRTP